MTKNLCHDVRIETFVLSYTTLTEPHLGREEALIRESVTDNFRIVLYVYFLCLALSVML